MVQSSLQSIHKKCAKCLSHPKMDVLHAFSCYKIVRMHYSQTEQLALRKEYFLNKPKKSITF